MSLRTDAEPGLLLAALDDEDLSLADEDFAESERLASDGEWQSVCRHNPRPSVISGAWNARGGRVVKPRVAADSPGPGGGAELPVCLSAHSARR